MSILHLGQMTWNEVQTFVSEKVVALLPLGSLVAHGPHLPLNTDVVIATEMAKRASRKLSTHGSQVLICPPVAYSPALQGKDFAGTMNVAPGAYSNYLRSLMADLAGMGLRTVCLVSCHVDPSHLQAVAQCRVALAGALGPEAMKVVFPDLTQEPWVHLMPAEFRNGSGHAGHFETSCMLAIHAEHVREDVRKKLPKVTASLTAGVLEGKSGFAECGGPKAYFGDPAGATSSHGEDFLEALATIIVDSLEEPKPPA